MSIYVSHFSDKSTKAFGIRETNRGGTTQAMVHAYANGWNHDER